jgi:hypothetical protein
MNATYAAAQDGSEAEIKFTPETELDRALLRALRSEFAVWSTRSELGTRALLEVRLVVKGIYNGHARATDGD